MKSNIYFAYFPVRRMLRVLKCDFKPAESVPSAKSLSDKIHNLNKSTVINTHMTMRTGEQCDAPAGLGVFSPDTLDRDQMKVADGEITRLFNQTQVLDSLAANVRGHEFIALFWQNRGQPIVSLQEMMQRLKPHTPTLVEILESSYIPLMAKVMRISENDVREASAEVIRYWPHTGGLGSHIDNVIRTKGVMGPICSINLVTDRSIDLLPTFVPSGRPARLDTQRGDLLVMDSDARTLWSHSVPFGDNRYRFSVIVRPVVRPPGKDKNRGKSPFGTIIPHPKF